MFSGKTEELIRQIRRAELARQSIQVFKPRIDNRYHETDIASHSKIRQPSQVVDSSADILQLVEASTRVVGIDECQFFDEGIVAVAQKLVERGHRVLAAGLDTDWRGRPFGPMPNLLSLADVIRKQYAICTVCGEQATRTQRVVLDNKDIVVGAQDFYEARCRAHFDPEFSFRVKNSCEITAN